MPGPDPELFKGDRSTGDSYHGRNTPDIFVYRAFKEKVVDEFFFGTKHGHD